MQEKKNCLTTWDYQTRRVYGCDGKWPTLTAGAKTSGQNQQAVLQPVMSVKQYPYCKRTRPRFKDDSETYIDCKVANTLNTFDLGDKRANEVIVEIVPENCDQGNCRNYSDTSECNNGLNERTSLALSSSDQPTGVFAIDQGGGKSGANFHLDVSPTLTCTHGGEPAVSYLASGKEVFGTLQANAGTKRWLGNQEAQSGNYHIIEEKPQIYTQSSYDNFVHGIGATLKASGGSYGGGSESLVVENKPNYIVRRLTPTECARLQGFADNWGTPEPKEDFTDEEYEFWLDVRNTYASVNGKREKEYTKPQMLTWYNKLHSDSAEYKMWGNGVALPPTLYVMQGIYDVMKEERE